ncbi:CGNR zinc finger domain-containing protein [Nocardioides lentus]|uniref:CGNR zinc finger domain-containing protein n=1 Tax=Nocardioides lentus TaxID=338077 RepID=A0ABP5B4E4_9ACTN
MDFTHDTVMALQAATALVNSAEAPDTLTDVEDLHALWLEYGYTGRHDRDEVELAAVRELRPVLRDLLTAERDEAAPVVNRLLAEAGAVPRLARHDGWDWHLHAIDDDRPLADRIVVETAMAMIDVIRADELSRLALCAADGCAGLVLDLSRNRSRRFCSTTCGNREAAAAYRARRRDGG